MAQTDTSIYSNFLRPPKSVEEYDQEFQQAKGNRLALASQQSQYDQQQKGIADEQKLSGLYQNALNPDGSLDRNRLYSGAASGGLGARIPGLQKQFLDLDKTQAEVADKKASTAKTGADTDKVQFETALNKQKAIAELAATATDQTSWTRAKTIAQAIGADVSQIPDQFDPGTARQLADMAVSQVQRMEQALRERQHAETVRNNRAQNSVSQGNLAVAQGNLGLSRQRLALDQSQPKGQYDAKRGVMVDPRTGVATPVTLDGKPIASDVGGKPLPVGALKMQQEALDAIGTASGINADIGAIREQLASGKLNLSPVNNLMGGALNAVGMSTEGSRNLASFKNTMEKLRNDSLRLNKGVQTDGDAQRAWNELITNINDPQVVAQRLDEIARINERAVALHEMAVNTIRQNYGAEAMDTSSRANQPAAVGTPKPAAQPAQAAKPATRTVTRTGNVGGRKVVQYSDGTTEYADQRK